jgi:hypothetical protein
MRQYNGQVSCCHIGASNVAAPRLQPTTHRLNRRDRRWLRFVRLIVWARCPAMYCRRAMGKQSTTGSPLGCRLEQWSELGHGFIAPCALV